MIFTCLGSVVIQKPNFTFYGKFASLISPLLGKDVIFFSNKIFVLTSASFYQFLSFLKKKSDGVTNGYFVEIALVGLGFRFIKLGRVLLLKLGFAHYIKLILPETVVVTGYKKKLILFGVSFSEIEQFSRQLAAFRTPNVYKNKGVQLVGKTFRIKVGKQK